MAAPQQPPKDKASESGSATKKGANSGSAPPAKSQRSTSTQTASPISASAGPSSKKQSAAPTQSESKNVRKVPFRRANSGIWGKPKVFPLPKPLGTSTATSASTAPSAGFATIRSAAGSGSKARGQKKSHGENPTTSDKTRPTSTLNQRRGFGDSAESSSNIPSPAPAQVASTQSQALVQVGASAPVAEMEESEIAAAVKKYIDFAIGSSLAASAAATDSLSRLLLAAQAVEGASADIQTKAAYDKDKADFEKRLRQVEYNNMWLLKQNKALANKARDLQQQLDSLRREINSIALKPGPGQTIQAATITVQPPGGGPVQTIQMQVPWPLYPGQPFKARPVSALAPLASRSVTNPPRLQLSGQPPSGVPGYIMQSPVPLTPQKRQGSPSVETLATPSKRVAFELPRPLPPQLPSGTAGTPATTTTTTTGASASMVVADGKTRSVNFSESTGLTRLDGPLQKAAASTAAFPSAREAVSGSAPQAAVASAPRAASAAPSQGRGDREGSAESSMWVAQDDAGNDRPARKDAGTAPADGNADDTAATGEDDAAAAPPSAQRRSGIGAVSAPDFVATRHGSSSAHPSASMMTHFSITGDRPWSNTPYNANTEGRKRRKELQRSASSGQ